MLIYSTYLVTYGSPDQVQLFLACQICRYFSALNSNRLNQVFLSLDAYILHPSPLFFALFQFQKSLYHLRTR